LAVRFIQQHPHSNSFTLDYVRTYSYCTIILVGGRTSGYDDPVDVDDRVDVDDVVVVMAVVVVVLVVVVVEDVEVDVGDPVVLVVVEGFEVEVVVVVVAGICPVVVATPAEVSDMLCQKYYL
jgi:hypothetical protein